jgi:hypothetical protein
MLLNGAATIFVIAMIIGIAAQLWEFVLIAIFLGMVLSNIL